MKNGICPKCETKTVHQITDSAKSIGIAITWKSVADLAQYVCTNCGYTEFFVADETLLPEIAEKFPQV